MNCSRCGCALVDLDRYCPDCGKSAAYIVWSLVGAEVAEALTMPDGGALTIVAANEGTATVQVEIDLSVAVGLVFASTTTGRGAAPPRQEKRAPARGSARFDLMHVSGQQPSGAIRLRSRDGARTDWWERESWRTEEIRPGSRVRIHVRRWFCGSPTVLFPPGVSRQPVRIWNDAPEAREFATAAPAGFRATCFTQPIERVPQRVGPWSALNLAVSTETTTNGSVLPPLTVWALDAGDSGSEPITLRCHAGAAAALDATPSDADVVIAIDFGTRNTGVRVRWRRELIPTKPAGTVDAIGDDAAGTDLGAADGAVKEGTRRRYPTTMLLHRDEATFEWGTAAQRKADLNRLGPGEVLVHDLKTDLRNGVERYTAHHQRWTNENLLGRYFERVFTAIDRYLAEADPRRPLRRGSLNVRYVLTRPVLDANNGDEVGAVYETALLLAMDRCNVRDDRVTFVYEPEAAALGIARRRREDLLAVDDGTPIAVIDSGGGTTDIAVARVRHCGGSIALDVVGTYRLLLTEPLPGQLEAKVREFGGDVLDEVMAYYALEDASKVADSDDGDVPLSVRDPRYDVGADFATFLRAVHRRFKEQFISRPKQYYSEPFPTRDDLAGVYVEQGLFAENVAFPLLRGPARSTSATSIS